MAFGIVKWFSKQKGYGFIMQTEGPDVFVHCNDIAGGPTTLREGQQCTFDINESPKGLQALKVNPGEMDANYVPPARPNGQRRFNGNGRRRSYDDYSGHDRGGKRRY